VKQDVTVLRFSSEWQMKGCKGQESGVKPIKEF
jgi:hypothetical protein